MIIILFCGADRAKIGVNFNNGHSYKTKRQKTNRIEIHGEWLASFEGLEIVLQQGALLMAKEALLLSLLIKADLRGLRVLRGRQLSPFHDLERSLQCRRSSL